jgi:hypothetical protein
MTSSEVSKWWRIICARKKAIKSKQIIFIEGLNSEVLSLNMAFLVNVCTGDNTLPGKQSKDEVHGGKQQKYMEKQSVKRTASTCVSSNGH